MMTNLLCNEPQLISCPARNKTKGSRASFSKKNVDVLSRHLTRQSGRMKLAPSESYKHSDIMGAHEIYLESKRKSDLWNDFSDNEFSSRGAKTRRRRSSIHHDDSKQKTLNSHMDQVMAIRGFTLRDMRQESTRLSVQSRESLKLEDLFDEKEHDPDNNDSSKVRISLEDSSVHNYVAVEDEETKDVWYTRADLESFNRDVLTTVTALNINYNDPDKLDKDKFCLRGIERYLDSSIDRKRRKLITRMVRAQNELRSSQSSVESSSCHSDCSDILLEMAAVGSEEAIQKALSLANSDAQDATDYQEEEEDLIPVFNTPQQHQEEKGRAENNEDQFSIDDDDSSMDLPETSTSNTVLASANDSFHIKQATATRTSFYSGDVRMEFDLPLI